MKPKFLAIALMMLTTAVQADQDETKAVADKLRTLYPATQFNEIRPSKFDGLYEVVMGKNIGYTDSEGRYFLFGHVFDMQTRQDLTAQRLDELNTIDVSVLPLKDAIKIVHGNGTRKLYVFDDPDCPFCRRLENELPKLDNITIYIFPMPLEGLHPNAPQVARSIWCSSNRQAAWVDYMLTNKQPAGKTDCPNPIERNVLLGQRLGVNGTPTLVAADGRVMPGFAEASRIESWLNQKEDN